MKSLAVIVLACIGLTYANVCLNQPDGYVPEYACRAYTVCQGGQPTELECASNQAFDSSYMECRPIDSVPAPCGYWRDCSGKEDKRYLDYENFGCSAYYTCHNGYYYSFNFCPDGLVFDEALQLCNWPYSVPPPCGTA